MDFLSAQNRIMRALELDWRQTHLLWRHRALLRRYSPQLRYESQETYFADSAAEMTPPPSATTTAPTLAKSGRSP